MSILKLLNFKFLLLIQKVSAAGLEAPFSREEASDPKQAVALLMGSINNLVLAMRNIVLALGLLFIIVGAIKLATSAGNPEKLEEGKQTILWAIVAIILGVSFWFIIVMIFNSILGIDTFGADGVQFDVRDVNF